MLNPLGLCSINGTTQPGWQRVCLPHGLLNILSPLLRPTAQKKSPFNILLLFENAPDHPRALMEMDNEIHVVFIPANTTSILQPMNQGIISGTSLAVQWLRLCTSNAGGGGSIPGQGTKIPHATWHGPPPHQKRGNFNFQLFFSSGCAAQLVGS